jgi:hypothetical protein
VLDIEWILHAAVEVTKLRDNYVVQEHDGDSRQCVITMSPTGRMLFDGEDIETEDFMAYVGMLDQVDEDPTHNVAFHAGE